MSGARCRGTLLAAGLGCLMAAGEAAGEEAGGFWWGGVDVGVSSLSRTYSVTPDTRETVLSLAFRGGYAWHRRLLLGVELGGWGLEAANIWDPREGEGIQTFHAIAQLYPLDRSMLFVKGGWGHVRYWNNRPSEHGASGTGAVLGAGYDFPAGKSWYVTPVIDYSWGEYDGAVSPAGISQDQRFRTLTLRLGVSLRSNGINGRN